jgi:hypothetical protein
MNTKMTFLVILALLLSILACTLGQTPPLPAATEPAPPTQTSSTLTDVPPPTAGPPPSGDVLMPDDLEYLGVFRLPEASGGSNWEYSGQGLTYYPDGDPDSPDDGFPGSLFGFGHDHHVQVSEISIPVPVISKNLDDLNTAVTLQPFADISGGLFNPEEMDLPVADLAYLPPQADGETGKLHFTFGQHFQDFEPSHGWAELDLSNPRPAGPWVFDGYTNYVSNDYLFDIPPDWTAAYAPGQPLATGRFREGVWGGYGPTLFAYSPPADDTTVTSITPLLLYGVQEPGLTDIVTDESMQMNGYQLADHWLGGAWLSSDDKSAVIFVGTKALGHSWYGFGNGVVWEYDCAEQNPPTCPDPPDWPYDNRGYWAEDYQAQIIFYNPADLGAVARGEMQTWEPQPYTTLVLDEYLFDPELDPAEYKRDLVAAAAFDRVHGYLFVIERLADAYQSVIHVWRVVP